MFGITRSPFDFFGSSWTPASLSTLRQWLADNYYSSPVGGLQVIESLETHGTVRAPEPGAYWNLDGVNDYGTLGGSNRLTSGGQTAFTITATLIPDSITGNLAICSEWATGSIFVLHQSNAKLQLLVYYGESPTKTSTSTTDSDVLAVGVPVKIAVTYNAGVVVFYVNGVVVANTQTGGAATALRSVASRFNVGALDAGTWCYDGKICSLRMYSTVKTLAEIEAIRDCDGTAIDKTNALVIYPCSERAGTTGYNIVANANHLTLSGPITEATFHATDTSITNNVNNVLGYRLSGGVRIPAIDSTTAADGNALTYTGLSPYPATIETPCITLDGTNDYINLGDISTSPTTISIVLKLASDDQEIMTLQNSTATAVTVVAGVLTFGGSLTVSAISVDGSVVSAAAAGALLNDNEWHTLSLTLTAISCSALRIGTDGSGFGAISVCELELTASGATKTFPFQEGQGTASDNVTVYWYKTDETYGSIASALVGVTVASAWANRCPGYVRDHAFEYGGRLDALGAFCPLVPGTALCADGNAATLSAGKRGNPYSKMIPSPFDAAELNKFGFTSATRIDSDETFDDASSIADTGFGRISADGIDREFLTDESLTGADLTNAQAYTA